jgi:hypothetical protein
VHEVVGNLHIHSHYSDGRGSIADIAVQAEKAALDFVIITDHNTLQGKHKGEEAYYGNVLVLIGMEVNTEAHHYLALGVEHEVPENDDDPQQVINEVNRQQGWGGIAHPFEKGSPLYRNSLCFPWTDWGVSGFQGIEIWNYLSQWKDSIHTIPQGIYRLFFPHSAFRAACQPALEQWDIYLQKGEKVLAFGGSDAHDVKVKCKTWLPSFTISSYQKCFRSITTHLLLSNALTGRFEHDASLIYESLHRGCSWTAYDYFQSSRGFQFYMQSPAAIAQMGERIALHKNLEAHIYTPARAEVHLYHDGKLWDKSHGKQHVFTNIQSGVYRVEVWHRVRGIKRAWIYSNPIWVS